MGASDADTVATERQNRYADYQHQHDE